jgi:DNA uptake protein ComE-like DNA-binding protein
LRIAEGKVENEGVQSRMKWTIAAGAILASAILCASLNGLATGLVVGLAQSPTKQKAVPPPEERVDINAASLNELLEIPGLTQTWAERIIRFRPYRGKNDLLERGVVSGQVYDRIKDYVIAHREKPPAVGQQHLR